MSAVGDNGAVSGSVGYRFLGPSSPVQRLALSSGTADTPTSPPFTISHGAVKAFGISQVHKRSMKVFLSHFSFSWRYVYSGLRCSKA